jgi:hypothetical protein
VSLADGAKEIPLGAGDERASTPEEPASVNGIFGRRLSSRDFGRVFPAQGCPVPLLARLAANGAIEIFRSGRRSLEDLVECGFDSPGVTVYVARARQHYLQARVSAPRIWKIRHRS